ncbi:MAG TPA: hypothetical protein VFC71_11860 [Candidatus Polarisedimenticolia bacterium]|nr:hypothetical protein [Candidatus Polarisedimenticolia bacterium]
MNHSTDPSFDSRIADWLEHDPNQAPDQALATVLAAIPSISQRRRLPVSWGFDRNAGVLRLAAAAVIALAVLGAIYVNLPGRNDVGGPTPMPTVSPTVEPTVRPTPTPRIAGATIAVEGRALTPGVRYVFPDFEPAFTFTGSASITFGIDGPPFAFLEHSAATFAALGVVRPSAVFAEGGTVEVVPADIVTWLQGRSDLVISSITPVTLGSASGTLLEGTVPLDAFHNAGNAINVFCPNATGCNFESGGSIGYAPGDHVLILVTEVDGQPVTAIATGPESAWATMGVDGDAFLRSFDFP